MEKTKIKKSETEEKGQEDVILSKVPIIEKFMGRTFIALLDLRSIYDFPMKKRVGFPSLSMAEFKAWAKEYGVDNVDPKEITTTMLEAHRKKITESLEEDRLLNGIDEIVSFTGWPLHEIIDWFKFRVGCPITKLGRVYNVGSKELSNWMRENNIKKGCGREQFPL